MKFNFLDEIINMLTKLLEFNKKIEFKSLKLEMPVLSFECGPTTYREQTLADIGKEEN